MREEVRALQESSQAATALIEALTRRVVILENVNNPRQEDLLVLLTRRVVDVESSLLASENQAAEQVQAAEHHMLSSSCGSERSMGTSCGSNSKPEKNSETGRRWSKMQ